MAKIRDHEDDKRQNRHRFCWPRERSKAVVPEHLSARKAKSFKECGSTKAEGDPLLLQCTPKRRRDDGEEWQPQHELRRVHELNANTSEHHESRQSISNHLRDKRTRGEAHAACPGKKSPRSKIVRSQISPATRSSTRRFETYLSRISKVVCQLGQRGLFVYTAELVVLLFLTGLGVKGMADKQRLIASFVYGAWFAHAPGNLECGCPFCRCRRSSSCRIEDPTRSRSL